MQGRSPYKFMAAFNVTLFLSANEVDLREAVALGLRVGQVIGASAARDDRTDLRIVFDFDGVRADNSDKP